jgi:hypothetical protein
MDTVTSAISTLDTGLDLITANDVIVEMAVPRLILKLNAQTGAIQPVPYNIIYYNIPVLYNNTTVPASCTGPYGIILVLIIPALYTAPIPTAQYQYYTALYDAPVLLSVL